MQPATPLGAGQVNVLLLFPDPVNPRKVPAKLSFPIGATHIMEKYASHVDCLETHAGYQEETEYTQGQMRSFSNELRSMKCAHPLKIFLRVDAPDGPQKTVEEAAFSRRHPIYDGHDYWEVYLAEHRSSAATDSGGSAPV
jgi:hypothetical protein